ncbi:MAG: YggS family pyridoxal phosphate-dependent enzyme, partial [Merismopedia sp. SIO2A8]|nr:YggS family pyridoxal phosphate-dependent enzyme [Merismopedia sp. SIO2A8]
YAIRAAYELGLRDFGESRVQEALVKQEALADLTDITWHFIGPLQSNKVAKALRAFDWIHSVSSLKLAQKINQVLESRSSWPCPKLCLQVKIVPDDNKSGWEPNTIFEDLDALTQLNHLTFAGLTTIPPFNQSDDQIYSVFVKAKELAAQIQRMKLANFHINELSMGMSGDYPIAIQAGATMVRIGRSLFGERV